MAGGEATSLQFLTEDAARVAAAMAVAAKLTRAGFQTLFAGGCVRDALLQRPLKDIDLATAATPDQVEACFAGATIAVGKAFGVVLVKYRGFQFDVATFRSDGHYGDGRHPESVCYVTAEGDAQRRDFTVNGLFFDPRDGTVTDYVGGLSDLKNGMIRAIGDPLARFRDDHLRMLRAVRFASVLGFTIDAHTVEALEACANQIGLVSAERIATEIERMLCESPQPSVGLELLRKTGLLRHVLPEVERLVGVAQPPQYHPEGDVWTHTCLMLDSLPMPRHPSLAWAVLLHDIGKPVTFREEPNPKDGSLRIQFPCHAPVGAKLAEALLTRLRLPGARIAAVGWLVVNHMRFVDVLKMRQAKLRRLMGEPFFPLLLELIRVDTLHSNGDFTAWRFLRESFDAFASEPVLPEPLIRGRDLLAWGLPSGPRIGRLLDELYDAQLESRIQTVDDARAYVMKRLGR